MTETTPLRALRTFSPGSPLASDDQSTRDLALRQLVRGLEPGKPIRRKVSDLLTVVMALSARTRRMVQPKVEIDMDVFAPNGKRAVRLYLNDR